MSKIELLKGFILVMVLVLAKILVVGCSRSGNSDAGTGPIVGIVSKSKSSVFCRAELEDIYEGLKTEFENTTMSEMTYEEVSDTYFDGVEGEHEVMGPNTDAYHWYSNDDEWASLSVFFDDFGDGVRIGSGVSGKFPES